MQFITAKPVLYVCNVDENAMKSGNKYVDSVKNAVKMEDAEILLIATAIESEIAELDDLEENEILIYPNPTTDIINITAKNDIKIDVINLLGEIIITIENQDQINLSQYSNGLYILDITYNNIKIQHKIIKK